MDYLTMLKNYCPVCEQEEGDLSLALELCRREGHGILTRASLEAHLTPSALILNQALDKVLMVHHNLYRTWCWTGGHADGDPDPLHVALKEAQEETGVPASPLFPQLAAFDILPVEGHYKNGAYVPAHLHLCPSFLLIASEDAVTTVRFGENTGVRWFSIGQIVEASGERCMEPIFQKLLNRANRWKEGGR